LPFPSWFLLRFFVLFVPFVVHFTREHRMASAAQVEANRRNAQKSTGPRTEAGKARIRLNALKSGAFSRAVTPVLPHEDPRELEGRIQQWSEDLEPQNAVERDLAARAARLSWVLERAERYETAHLARRVRKAQLKLTARRTQQVCDLGRKLLYNPGPRGLANSKRPWDDNPAAFLRGLEESVQGCQWLLERWRELQNLTARSVEWTRADMFKLIRLQGKFPIEAINDRTLNAVFLAWDTISPGTAQKFWSACKECKPLDDPGFNDCMRWREIADRPADADHAKLFLTTFMDEQIASLEERISLLEEVAGDDDAELANLASFEPSASFERLRRFQSSKSRELRQTLDTLFKLRESGGGIRNGKTCRETGGEETANGKWDKWAMANGKWEMANGEGDRANGEGQMTDGEGDMIYGEGQMTGGEENTADGNNRWVTGDDLIAARRAAMARTGLSEIETGEKDWNEAKAGSPQAVVRKEATPELHASGQGKQTQSPCAPPLTRDQAEARLFTTEMENHTVPASTPVKSE
jgi:hypothetical protein